MTVMSLRWLRFGVVAVLAVLAACASGKVASPGLGRPNPIGSYNPNLGSVAGGAAQFAAIYRQMGLASSGPPMSFVGNVAYFATRSPDTTLVAIGMSLPNKGLAFKKDDNNYSASYTVDLTLQGETGATQQAEDSESVRVSTFSEISRTDESVIYRRTFKAVPGNYALSYSVRDGTSQRNASQRMMLVVPRMSSSSVSSIEPVYEAKQRVHLDSVPSYLPAPRASYEFGVDDSAAVYLESYNPSVPINMELLTTDGKVGWSGTRTLPVGAPGLASGVVTVPLAHADVGIGTILAWQAGSHDTVATRIFMGFGPDLPVLTFSEMLGYLRYFSNTGKLQPLYNASPGERGLRWAEFLRATDPDPSTPQNEALNQYFGRISDANAAFANDTPPGWLSDRGTVFVTLGTPSDVYQDYGVKYIGEIPLPGEVPSRVKILVWAYDEYQTQIIFYDPDNTQAWRMTRSSAAIFRSLLSRAMNR